MHRAFKCSKKSVGGSIAPLLLSASTSSSSVLTLPSVQRKEKSDGMYCFKPGRCLRINLSWISPFLMLLRWYLGIAILGSMSWFHVPQPSFHVLVVPEIGINNGNQDILRCQTIHKDFSNPCIIISRLGWAHQLLRWFRMKQELGSYGTKVGNISIFTIHKVHFQESSQLIMIGTQQVMWYAIHWNTETRCPTWHFFLA